MAPKRPENPPPATFSDDEEEEESGSGSGSETEPDEENDDRHPAVGRPDDDNDDGVEDEEDEESPVTKKSVAVAATPQKSDSATESEDSESTQPSPSLSAFTIKLHKRSPKPEKSAPKRPAESDNIGRSGKKSKLPTDDEEVKKGAIQRLWSEEDEIAILSGLSQYRSEKGADPYSDMGAFHDFLKKSLHVDVSKNQLIDKIRRLKKKYQNNVERVENGQDPVFSKSHDEKTFELSKKIWGNNQKKETAKQFGRVHNNNNSSNDTGGITLGLVAGQGNKGATPATPAGKKPFRAPNVENKSCEEKTDKAEDVWTKYPFFSESLEIEGLSDGVKVMLRERLGMIERGKLKELDNKWKKLKQAELEMFVQRAELVQHQVKLALDSIQSDGS